MTIPQWLTLILDNCESFEVEGGKLSGTTDYVYTFNAKTFNHWLVLSEDNSIEVYLRIKWDNPDNPQYLLGFWHKTKGVDLLGDDIWVDTASSTPQTFCERLDYLKQKAKKRRWLKA